MKTLKLFSITFKEQNKDGRECIKVIASNEEVAIDKLRSKYDIEMFLKIEVEKVYI